MGVVGLTSLGLWCVPPRCQGEGRSLSDYGAVLANDVVAGVTEGTWCLQQTRLEFKVTSFKQRRQTAATTQYTAINMATTQILCKDPY